MLELKSRKKRKEKKRKFVCLFVGIVVGNRLVRETVSV